MDRKNQQRQLVVPKEMQALLFEFTVTFLLEQPEDIYQFAVEFFTKMRDLNSSSVPTKRIRRSSGADSDEDDEEALRSRRAMRRKSVYGETYDPEHVSQDVPNNFYPKTPEQRNKLASALQNILMFRYLEAEELCQVLDAMFEVLVYGGQEVIKEGDAADYFYVIDSGEFEKFSKGDGDEEKLQGRYHKGQSFGELALLYNTPRGATVRATTSGALWALDRETFRRVVLKGADRKRRAYEQLINNVPILASLENYERIKIADALTPRHYSDKQVIFKQGDVSDGMYFVMEGVVSVKVRLNSGEETEVRRIGQDGYFGELGLLTHRPRAATAYTMGNCKLAFLDVDAFERLLGPCQDVMKRNIVEYHNHLLNLFGSTTNN